MEQRKVVRVIILIIASRGEIYDHFRTIWERYMNSNENIKSFFLYGDTDVSSDNEINCNVGENFYPGILLKTINGLKQIEKEYDYEYVVRTNLSSFYNFTLLLTHINTLPKKDCYSGFPMYNYSPLVFASGCGYIISRDVANLLVKDERMLECTWDDVSVGRFMLVHNIHILPEPLYTILYNGKYELKNGKFEIEDIEKEKITKDIYDNCNNFHYRVRNDTYRIVIDKFISETLYKCHYNQL